MQPTESRQRDNFVAIRRHGCWNSTTRGVLPQCEMSPVLVVIADIFIQQPPQMSPIQHDHMIEQIPSYATNPALRNSVLPRTTEGSAHRGGLALAKRAEVKSPFARHSLLNRTPFAIGWAQTCTPFSALREFWRFLGLTSRKQVSLLQVGGRNLREGPPNAQKLVRS